MQRGQLVLIDPAGYAMIQAVERENCRRLLRDTMLDRVEHFAQRISERGATPADLVIVILNQDDANGAALGEILMPGHDWNAYRARGEVPYARGLAERPGLQELFDASGHACAAELKAIDGIAVVMMDRGIIAAFTLDEVWKV